MKKPESPYKLLQTSINSIGLLDSQNLTIAEITRDTPIESKSNLKGESKEWQIARLLEMSPALYDIAKEFCKRVESGEVKSRATYYKMKEIIDYVGI
jgi:hypothetical protein